MKAGALNDGGAGLVYRGSLVFRRDSLGVLSFESAPIAAGRITATGVRYHVTDHLGSVRGVVDGATGNLLEASDYEAYGLRSDAANLPSGLSVSTPPAGEATFRYHYTGQEDQGADFGLPYTDFGARHYSPSLRRWLAPDPLSEKYYDVSPYAYCAGDPVNMVDVGGLDWYICNETGYYTWFEGSEDHEGYIYVGPKWSVLGEMEDIINSVLVHTLNIESMYTNNFTFELSPSKKGVFSNENSIGFFQDFRTNTGPEFSVLLQDHPMTQQMKKTPLVRRMEEELQRNGSCECVKAVDNWSLLDALYYMKGVLAEGQNYSLTRQFVGTYSYRGRISSGGNYIYNLVLDSKSRESFFLHIPSNRRRSECSRYGNTYQFYVWVSLRN